MAYRASTLSTQPVTTSLTCTRPTTVAGDFMVCWASGDTSQTLTMTGWTKLDQTVISGPDIQTIALFYIASATGSDPMVLSGSATQQLTAIIATFSGRSTSAPTWAVTTPNTSSNSSPVSISLTGVTASSGDDVGAAPLLDVTSNTVTWSMTATPSGYTSRQSFPPANNWSIGGLVTQDNVSAGSTGSLAFTATGTSGTSGWSGYVASISATGGGGGAVQQFITLLGVGN